MAAIRSYLVTTIRSYMVTAVRSYLVAAAITTLVLFIPTALPSPFSQMAGFVLTNLLILGYY